MLIGRAGFTMQYLVVRLLQKKCNKLIRECRIRRVSTPVSHPRKNLTHPYYVIPFTLYSVNRQTSAIRLLHYYMNASQRELPYSLGVVSRATREFTIYIQPLFDEILEELSLLLRWVNLIHESDKIIGTNTLTEHLSPTLMRGVPSHTSLMGDVTAPDYPTFEEEFITPYPNIQKLIEAVIIEEVLQGGL